MSMILKNQLNWRFFYEIVATFAQLLKKIILNFLDVDSNVPSVGADEALPSFPALSLVSLPSLSGSDISLGDLDDLSLDDIAVEVVPSTNCSSCKFGFSDPAKASSCFRCNARICSSIPCIIDNLCKLCFNQDQMDSEREDARRKTRKQADKMLELSRYAVTYLFPYDTITDFLRKRFGETKAGDTVLLAIPDLDRGSCARGAGRWVVQAWV